MSYYLDLPEDDEVREPEPEEKRCPRCRGVGTVELHGQETDCIDCDGWGSVLI